MTYGFQFPVPVAVKSRAALQKVADMRGGRLGKVGGYFERNVLGIYGAHPSRSGQEILRELWVRPDYRGYRKAFAKTVGVDLVGMDVDHIFPKIRTSHRGEGGSEQVYAYVRLLPVSQSSNRSWGTAEKRMTPVLAKPVGPAAEPDIRWMSFFSVAKFLGLRVGSPEYLAFVLGTDEHKTLAAMKEAGLIWGPHELSEFHPVMRSEKA